MEIHLCRSRRQSGVVQATIIWECLELAGPTIRPWVVAKGYMGALRCPYNVFLVKVQPVSLTVVWAVLLLDVTDTCSRESCFQRPKPTLVPEHLFEQFPSPTVNPYSWSVGKAAHPSFGCFRFSLSGKRQKMPRQKTFKKRNVVFFERSAWSPRDLRGDFRGDSSALSNPHSHLIHVSERAISIENEFNILIPRYLFLSIRDRRAQNRTVGTMKD